MRVGCHTEKFIHAPTKKCLVVQCHQNLKVKHLPSCQVGNRAQATTLFYCQSEQRFLENKKSKLDINKLPWFNLMRWELSWPSDPLHCIDTIPSFDQGAPSIEPLLLWAFRHHRVWVGLPSFGNLLCDDFVHIDHFDFVQISSPAVDWSPFFPLSRLSIDSRCNFLPGSDSYWQGGQAAQMLCNVDQMLLVTTFPQLITALSNAACYQFSSATGKFSKFLMVSHCRKI